MSTGSSNVQSITLKPGEVFTLPPSATLLYVSDTDSIQSDCTDIPVPVTVCYQLAWQFNDTDNLEDATFTKVTFENGMSFDIGGSVSYNGIFSSEDLYNWVLTTFNRPEIMEAKCTDADDDTQILKISVPESFGIPTFEITNPTDAGTVKLFLQGTLVEDCEDCSELS